MKTTIEFTIEELTRQLCYVEERGDYCYALYFTDNFATQWGDDWNDIPYEHNAGPPYEVCEGEERHGNEGHIIRLFVVDGWFKTPCDNHRNSPYSVQSINRECSPAWLQCNRHNLLPGDTLADCFAILQKENCTILLELTANE